MENAPARYNLVMMLPFVKRLVNKPGWLEYPCIKYTVLFVLHCHQQVCLGNNGGQCSGSTWTSPWVGTRGQLDPCRKNGISNLKNLRTRVPTEIVVCF